MKKYILLLFILFKTSASAQQLSTDSLQKLLASKPDTTRILFLSELSNNLCRSDPEKAFRLAQQGLQLSKQINYRKGELYCKVSLGWCWWSVGDYSTAIQLMLAEMKPVSLVNDFKLTSNLMGVLISSYEDEGDYSEALKLSLQGFNLEDRKGTCDYCKIVLASISDLYLKKNQLDSAHFFLFRALKYPAAFGLDGWTYSVAGRLYTELKNYDSAFQFYHESIQKLQEEDNLKDLAGVYNNIASLFTIIGMKDSSLEYAKRSSAISQPKKFAKEALETNLLLAGIYENLNTDSALYYYKKAIASKDSLYSQEKQRQILSYKYKQELQQQEIESEQEQYKKQIKIYLLSAAVVVFLIIAFLLFRNNKHKQRSFEILKKQKQQTDIQKLKAEQALQELKSTQAQLIQSEKMASLGELTAGIAHEIQNPLNFVNNFSEVNKELVDELEEEANQGNIDEVKAIAKDIKDNEEKILHHGKRADAIVKGMLQHTRKNSGTKEPTDINALVDEYLRLNYHGMRAKDKNFNAEIKTNFDDTIGKISVVPQDIGRVLINLFNNGFYAVSEKKKVAGNEYEPVVSVSTKKIDSKVQIHVEDNGNGIEEKIVDKIFQPFFTTKPTGQGTGLGLSLSYDIVKAHGGEIKVESKEGEGSEFTIELPLSIAQ